MRGKGRSLGIEEKLQKIVTDELCQEGSDLYRDKNTHKYYCRGCLSEVPLRKDCLNCGKKIDWSTIDTEYSSTSPPNPLFKPRRYT